MTEHASVVVLGGGVVGLSTAHHLARAGLSDVVVVERGSLGEGSTCRAAGGVRAMFTDALNVELGLRSLEAYERFAADHGQEIDLHRVGYLFLLDSPAALDTFAAAAPVQRALGLEVRELSVAETVAASPLVSPEGLLGGVLSPRAGHCTPEAVVAGYAASARRQGVRIRPGCAATGIEVVDGAITAVATEAGPIVTDTVVCATGAWSARVAAWAGVDLPVAGLRRHVALTGPLPGLDPATPFTIEHSSSYYFHREGGGLLMGLPDRTDEWTDDARRDEAWLEELGEAVERRTPALAESAIGIGWAGLYEMSPDHNALIGEADRPGDPSRFLYATGFSGHGFLMAPAVGEVVADLVLGRTPAVDVSALSVDRFDADAARPELHVV
ncbi:FAD-binding oxidoreductase [Nocardioides sp. CFH 31398]|uniref:NAD(P)/FAD-dependent oxidoreductase n=1 Tax=Nocardioides sp. CFH 31398 TaxID=2919579 RepID=UPI001F06F0A7|nr:FAD-binding oxidoreductase [Nocardioides sp. CFH 31398]MCH1866892.1 FAD-binding oxidoreductase [Nocardioides sp. CFH 31398]